MQALRYSQYNPFGTARYAAQGGAIGALGGDLSSVMVNPGRTGILPFFRILFFTFILLGEYQLQISWVHLPMIPRLKFNVGSMGMVTAMTRDREQWDCRCIIRIGIQYPGKF